MNAEQWLRVQQVYELVKQEGDARCEAAFEDLIYAHNTQAARAAGWRAVCESRDTGWAAVAAQEELRRLRAERDGCRTRVLAYAEQCDREQVHPDTNELRRRLG